MTICLFLPSAHLEFRRIIVNMSVYFAKREVWRVTQVFVISNELSKTFSPGKAVQTVKYFSTRLIDLFVKQDLKKIYRLQEKKKSCVPLEVSFYSLHIFPPLSVKTDAFTYSTEWVNLS